MYENSASAKNRLTTSLPRVLYSGRTRAALTARLFYTRRRWRARTFQFRVTFIRRNTAARLFGEYATNASAAQIRRRKCVFRTKFSKDSAVVLIARVPSEIETHDEMPPASPTRRLRAVRWEPSAARCRAQRETLQPSLSVRRDGKRVD